MDELLEWTLEEAVAALRAGRVSAAEYVDALLARCAEGGDLNAFVTLDDDGVRAAATTADEARAGGGDLGPLPGAPVVLKDNIDTASLPTTAGTPGLADHRPTVDAPVAARLFDAGAVLLGTTNLHELAFGITSNNAWSGPVRNPYDPGMIAGGSSGGTAAAVAARMAPAGLGTDTGGSLRIPAALCGVVGFRPSVGRWPQAGIVPLSHTRDTAGPIARTVADCLLLDGVVTGDREPTEPVALDGLRLGVPRPGFHDDLDPDVAAVVDAEHERLRALGVVLVDVELPGLAERNAATSFPVVLHEVVRDLARYLDDSGADVGLDELVAATVSPDVHGLLSSLLGDGAVPEPTYREALDEHRPALQAIYADCFATYDVAALLFPTTPLPARPVGADETVELLGQQVATFGTYIRNTDPASNAGVPGLSLPVALTPAGLPVGMELDGPYGGDLHLLAVGLAYQEATEPLPPPSVLQ